MVPLNGLIKATPTITEVETERNIVTISLKARGITRGGFRFIGFRHVGLRFTFGGFSFRGMGVKI